MSFKSKVYAIDCNASESVLITQKSYSENDYRPRVKSLRLTLSVSSEISHRHRTIQRFFAL